MPYKYDTATGKWSYVAGNPSEDNKKVSGGSGGSVGSSNPNTYVEAQVPSSELDNYETTETLDSAESDYITQEVAILEGDANILPNPKIHAKNTVRVEGVGKQLTGLYFVEKSTHTFGSEGYTHTVSLNREGFGDTIKQGNVAKPTIKNITDNGRPAPVQPSANNTNNGGGGNGYEVINRWGTVTPAIGLNVRTTPQYIANGSNKIGALTCGTRIFCLGKQNGWYQHKYNGRLAWSHADYVRLD